VTPPPAPSAWAPLGQRVFAVIWTATLVTNIGVWVRDVASGWLMTEMSPSPVMVALVQAVLTLPIFLLALPAGALADILDRRRILIGVQVLLLLATLAMALAVMAGAMTPAVLLALTFLAGMGAAVMQPAFQAIVPELVPKPLLRPAVALNSLGINIARAIGPALGGAILVTAGVAAAYLVDLASTLVVILALLWWRRAAAPARMPAEGFWPAMATGMGYAWRSPALPRVLLRAAAFFLFGSAYWALLPLVAREALGADAAFYGLMLTAIGAGAVTGALLLPRLQKGRAPGAVVLAGSLVTALAMAGLAFVPVRGLALVLLFAAGGAWIAVLTNLNVAAQSSLPNWVRARGLAVYLMVFYGAMTAGSALWGAVAQALSLTAALAIAALACAAVALLAARVALPEGEADLTPSGHWPEPPVAAPVEGERGPVMVTIHWQVAPDSRDAFLRAALGFAQRRRRDGAFGWQIYEDAAQPGRFTEVFHAVSWLEHLRQHGRMTADDQAAQEALWRFQQGGGRPAVRHHLAARPGDGPAAASPPEEARRIA
jgi:MFS family permease